MSLTSRVRTKNFVQCSWIVVRHISGRLLDKMLSVFPSPSQEWANRSTLTYVSAHIAMWVVSCVAFEFRWLVGNFSRQVCLKPNVQDVIWTFRVRLCGPCKKTKFVYTSSSILISLNIVNSTISHRTLRGLDQYCDDQGRVLPYVGADLVKNNGKIILVIWWSVFMFWWSNL